MSVGGNRWRLRLLAAALLAVSCAKGVESEEEEGAVDADRDDATARRKAMDEWYNEAHPESRDGRGGGMWSPEYRRFMLTAAAKERERWADRLPGTGFRPLVTGQNWVNIGPNKADFLHNGSFSLNKTDAGRIRSIVVAPDSPQHLYVATSGGGLWETTDAYANPPAWTPLTETVGSLSIGSFAIDPSSPNNFYLGLGDPFDGTGIGLLRATSRDATDGHIRWEDHPIITLGNSTRIPHLVVANGVVLVATDHGLYRSADGENFSLVAGGLPADPYVWSIAHTGGGNFVISLEALPNATSGTTDGQIWRSTDNGESWTRATGVTNGRNGVGRITVAANGNTVYAMGALPNSSDSADLADIYKSTDGGASFSGLRVTKKRYTNSNRESRNLATLMNGQGWYDQLVIVNPSNENQVFFGGALLLARTNDGGGSYTQVSNWLAQFSLPYVHADYHAATFSSDGSFYVGTDGGVFRTTDGGASWSDSLNIGIVSHLLYSMGSSPAAPDAVIGGMQDNGTRVRDGASLTYNQTIGGDGFGTDINAANPTLMLGSLYYTDIRKSTDGGLTFSAACTGIAECRNSSSAPFITHIVAYPGDATGNTVFTHVNLKVYKTTNYAGSWSALGSTGIAATTYAIRNMNVDASNSNHIGLALTAGRVSLTRDGGGTWKQAASPPDNALSMSDVVFNPYDASGNTVWVSSVAPDATAAHLWKSTDYGDTWAIIAPGADDAADNGLPKGVPINFIKYDTDMAAPNVLFAGTHLGVYRSTDGGVTWVRFGNGMPLVNVTGLYISPSGGLVRAATYGRGFWELTP